MAQRLALSRKKRLPLGAPDVVIQEFSNALVRTQKTKTPVWFNQNRTGVCLARNYQLVIAIIQSLLTKVNAI